MHDETRVLLARTELGSNLGPAAVARLAAIARVLEVAEGETLLRADHACPFLGIVVDGRISLRSSLPGRHDATLMTLDRGDTFGWSAVLPSDATSTAVASSAARVLLMDRDPLRDALAADAGLAATVYLYLLRVVAERLDATRLQLLDLYRATPDPW